MGSSTSRTRSKLRGVRLSGRASTSSAGRGTVEEVVESATSAENSSDGIQAAAARLRLSGAKTCTLALGVLVRLTLRKRSPEKTRGNAPGRGISATSGTAEKPAPKDP